MFYFEVDGRNHFEPAARSGHNCGLVDRFPQSCFENRTALRDNGRIGNRTTRRVRFVCFRESFLRNLSDSDPNPEILVSLLVPFARDSLPKIDMHRNAHPFKCGCTRVCTRVCFPWGNMSFSSAQQNQVKGFTLNPLLKSPAEPRSQLDLVFAPLHAPPRDGR